MKSLVPIILFAFAISRFDCCSAQSSAADETTAKDAKELQSALGKSCTQYRLPAMWAGMFQVNKPALVAVTGVRKWKETEAAQVDDILHLGSCTKAMTAAMIGQLCSEGKLKLDASLDEVFVDTEGLKDSTWAKVTIRELMQHQSGAPANFDYFRLDKHHPDRPDLARAELLELLLRSRRPKRVQFLYSNVGYILLGHAIEQIEGKPWETCIQSRIFDRLKMTSAGFGPVGEPDRVTDKERPYGRPYGHVEAMSLSDITKSLLGRETAVELTPNQIDNSPCLGPAGRVHMNLQDWSKFTIQFCAPGGNKLLGIDDEVWTSMLQPKEGVDDRYAAGWILFHNKTYDIDGLFHNGSNTTWYAYVLAIPETQATILVATNVHSDKARKACHEMAMSLASSRSKE